MTNTHLKSNRKFKPVKISDSLRGINQKFLYKFGKLDYIIYAKWAEIVGSFFVQHSEPRKISSIPQSTDEKGKTIYGQYLHVNVTPSAAVEFQHFHNKIVEKINSYFGYKAIKGIKIHFHISLVFFLYFHLWLPQNLFLMLQRKISLLEMKMLL